MTPKYNCRIACDTSHEARLLSTIIQFLVPQICILRILKDLFSNENVNSLNVNSQNERTAVHSSACESFDGIIGPTCDVEGGRRCCMDCRNSVRQRAVVEPGIDCHSNVYLQGERVGRLVKVDGRADLRKRLDILICIQISLIVSRDCQRMRQFHFPCAAVH